MAHGRALRAFVGSSLTIIIVAVLVSHFGSTVVADGYVDVPSEYFFGRWAQGHYAVADGRIRNDHSPQWRYGYTLTTGEFRFSIDSLASYGLWNSEHGLFETAHLNGWWRTAKTLQLGIADLSFRRTHDEKGPTAGASSSPVSSAALTQFSSLSSLQLSPSAAWMNYPSLRLNRDQALYSYYIADFVSAGEVLVESQSYLSLRASESGSLEYFDYTGRVQQDSRVLKDQSNSLDLDGTILLGILPDVNLGLHTLVRYRSSKLDTYRSRLTSDTAFLVSRSENESKQSQLEYELWVRARVLPALWVRVAVTQHFVGRSRTSFGETWESTVGYTSVRESYPIPFAADRNYFTLGVDYLTSSGFNLEALLDDYQDYYGHLLCAGQLRLSADITYMRFDAFRRVLRIGYLARTGWFDRLDVGLDGYYSYAEYPGVIFLGKYQRYLRADLRIRWRTFRYTPGQGPGWGRDSDYDIAFGTIPEAGHWIGTLSTNVLEAGDRSQTGVPVLAVWELDSDIGFDEYSLTQRLGLGHGIALEAVQNISFVGESLGKLRIGIHSYEVGVTARPLPMLQVSGSLKDAFRYWNNDYPAMWHITLQGLL